MGNILTKKPTTIECRRFHKAILRGDFSEVISRIQVSVHANTLQNLINAPNQRGYTPLQVAFREQKIDIFKLLILHGANTNVVNLSGLTLLMEVADGWPSHDWALALLECKNTNIRQTTPEGDTALGFAVSAGNAKLVNLLCKRARIHANEKGVDGNPIAISAFEKQKMIPGYAGLSIIKSLLAEGANINAVDENGNSLLMLAVCDGNYPELVRFLLEHKNIVLTIQNKQGETAFALAEKNGQHEYMDLLTRQINLQHMNERIASQAFPRATHNITFFNSRALTKRKAPDNDVVPTISRRLN